MYINYNELTPDQVYFNMIQTIIPRPIAWVLSANPGSGFNLAPFSYFNAICSDPPMIMLSIGKKPDGSDKDTRVNIAERSDFVVHIAHLGQLEALNQTSATLPAGESELDRVELELTDFAGSRLPRVAGCPVAMACSLDRIIELGAVPQALVLARVHGAFVDDAVLSVDAKGRTRINADRINPIGRLGGGEYVSFGEIIKAVRPA